MTLKVNIPPGFLPERQYILTVLFEEFLGLDIEINVNADLSSYEIICPLGKLTIADRFFNAIDEEEEWQLQAPFPGEVVDLKTPFQQSILVLYGDSYVAKDGVDWNCKVDLFAGAFFMLSRWEETRNTNPDQHGRMRAQDSVPGKHGFLLRPVVDEYTELLQKILQDLGVPQGSFKRNAFRVVMTCDIDHPRYHRSTLHPLRHMARAIFREKSMRSLYREAVNAARFWLGGKDPYDQISWMAKMAGESGADTVFYVFAGERSGFDPGSMLDNAGYRKSLEELQRTGCQFGLHGSYSSYDNSKLLKHEMDRLVDAIYGVSPICRQHYLRFSNPVTWQVIADCGFTHDSTLGFADAIGFRCGTSREFTVFDLEKREPLHLVEQPLLLMDVTLKNYMQLSPDDAIREASKLIHQVRKHNGNFVFLWHNSSFYGDGWEAYRRVFMHLIGGGRG